MRGSSTAYGPPSFTSTSKNCVSGGRSAADLPHSGVIHQSLHLAHARQRLERSCRQRSCCAFSRVYFRTTGSPYIIVPHVSVTLACVAEFRLALFAQTTAWHHHAIYSVQSRWFFNESIIHYVCTTYGLYSVPCQLESLLLQLRHSQPRSPK